ncbi:MAG: hypothetical protein KGM24_09100, partial [Elusimicrobia bacterium]|nr:hypothetical protein [Elusimicrobiota bacterium]
MELAGRALRLERALAALLAAAVLAAAWAQAGSPLAERIRSGRPWLAWVAAREPGVPVPTFHLAVYDPARRRLILLHVPGDEKVDGRRTLDETYRRALKGAKDPAAAESAAEDLAQSFLAALSPEPIPEISARLELPIHSLADEDEPALEAVRALKARTRSARAWAAWTAAAARGLLRGDRAALDPLLFALELRRVPADSLEPA